MDDRERGPHVKFGMAMMGLSPRWYPEVALAAEQNGFESIWMPEHLILPATMPPTYPYSESGYAAITGETPMFDPWVVLGSVASVTSTIRLSNNIYVLPLRHPIITARAVVTLDRISGGRVTLGAGVGWLEEEFEVMGENFENRGRRTDEIIGILRDLWTGEVVEHHGEFYDFGPVQCRPKPLQTPSIPIEIGGHGAPALRRAGRLADGWVEVASGTYERFTERLAVVNQARQEAGRRRPALRGDLRHRLRRREREAGRGDRRHPLRRQPPEQPEEPRPLLGAHDKETFSDWCKEFADEVISKVN